MLEQSLHIIKKKNNSFELKACCNLNHSRCYSPIVFNKSNLWIQRNAVNVYCVHIDVKSQFFQPHCPLICLLISLWNVNEWHANHCFQKSFYLCIFFLKPKWTLFINNSRWIFNSILFGCYQNYHLRESLQLSRLFRMNKLANCLVVGIRSNTNSFCIVVVSNNGIHSCVVVLVIQWNVWLRWMCIRFNCSGIWLGFLG